MHVDWQQIVALSIVALAFWAVARQLWAQVSAFRTKPRRASGPPRPAKPPADAPLIQLQTRPPAHLRRPPADGQ